jgi:hypothetical protein
VVRISSASPNNLNCSSIFFCSAGGFSLCLSGWSKRACPICSGGEGARGRGSGWKLMKRTFMLCYVMLWHGTFAPATKIAFTRKAVNAKEAANVRNMQFSTTLPMWYLAA